MASETFSVLTLLFNARRRLSNVVAGMVPEDEGFEEIEQAIADIDDRRDTLTRLLVKENTKKFVSANHELVKVNDKMKEALAELADMQKKIEAITSLVRAADNFIASVVPG